jgi:long-chain acyl-CoA synthetase
MELMIFWQCLGLNVSQFYTQTEVGGTVISAQDPAFPKPGHTGTPSEVSSVALNERGEILVKEQQPFDGYWNNSHLTRQVLDAEGWFHTGDLGEWTSEGHLKVIGRVDDMMRISNDRIINAASIENALKSRPYISEALVFYSEGIGIEALVEVSPDPVKDWAQNQNIPVTDLDQLLKHAEVFHLVQAEIQETNQDLSPAEQIVTFRIIPKILNPLEDDEPVTPTRKIKRFLMYERFKELFASMESEEGHRTDKPNQSHAPGS